MSEDAWDKHMLPLIEEFEVMIKRHDLPKLSADEALCELPETGDRYNQWKREYLTGFIVRWEKADTVYHLERRAVENV
jgi:hypothetical protein|tara:strand:+ start:230 stop:463 length:234 start_codon:yes stop_codon:yes gene_type:complete